MRRMFNMFNEVWVRDYNFYGRSLASGQLAMEYIEPVLWNIYGWSGIRCLYQHCVHIEVYDIQQMIIVFHQ